MTVVVAVVKPSGLWRWSMVWMRVEGGRVLEGRMVGSVRSGMKVVDD